MDYLPLIQRLAEPLGPDLEIQEGPTVRVRRPEALRERIELLVRKAVLSSEPERSAAQWLIRSTALELGILPASIHDLYMARGRGEVSDRFTVPAMNLRALPFFAARSVFRAAGRIDANALIFEIARSEMGYTAQSAAEYAASILAAAIAEGYHGPVFIQGDHFQVSAKQYAKQPEAEVEAIRVLAREAVRAGFFNIDIDTSTLVDLSRPNIPEQQEVNYRLCAELASYARQLEPEGVTISLGGEIGEVGGHNSTEPELRAFMEGFNGRLRELAPRAAGLSKISIQTGTSHGGVVLPDGSMAKVKVDFDTLARLSRVAKEYGMGGAVQHGASTLPEEAFGQFVEAGALEVHLATNFQNILYDLLDEELLHEIYAYLAQHHGDERKPTLTDDQFYYGARKRAIGPFKRQMWDMPGEAREEIQVAWEQQFDRLFRNLNIAGTREVVDRCVKPPRIEAPLRDYLGEKALSEAGADLAD